MYPAKLNKIKQAYVEQTWWKSLNTWIFATTNVVWHKHYETSILQSQIQKQIARVKKHIMLQWWYKSYIQGDGMHFSLSKAAFSNVSL